MIRDVTGEHPQTSLWTISNGDDEEVLQIGKSNIVLLLKEQAIHV